jgi:hypothetical protein
MKTLRIIAVAAIAGVLAVACSVKHTIIGKWQDVSGAKIEFSESGALKVSSSTAALGFVEGTYAFLDDGRVRLDTNWMTSFGTKVMSVRISGSELTLTDEDGRTAKYERVKG